MSEKDKELIHKLSYLLIVIPLLLALLLPEPYWNNGKTSPVFGGNGIGIAFFVLFMVSLSVIGIIVNYFTRIITPEKVKRIVMNWSREDSLRKMHGIINPIIKIVNDTQRINEREAMKKQNEYINNLKTAWENEKALNLQNDEAILKDLNELERLRKELDELKEFKIEKEQIEKELMRERSRE